MSKKLECKLNRKYDTRKQYKFIYIFTEGEKTEVNYFESKKKEIETEIRRQNIKIKIAGTGYNTLKLVNFAIEFIKERNIKIDNSENSDECWVVFDKDNFDQHFDNAIIKAGVNNLEVAYSNECFEIWFLLHFIPLSSAISRKDYILKLTDNLKKLTGNSKIRYSKISKDMYLLLKDTEKDAIRNAKKLLNMHKNEKSFSKKNPSTTVYLLVENLNKLKKE
ncbi:RloB domain-containing protein [Candidatus Parcubacteria bacterium]|nr:RloB domain-containing protein [Candidatus Parcubacteria bacterium]